MPIFGSEPRRRFAGGFALRPAILAMGCCPFVAAEGSSAGRASLGSLPTLRGTGARKHPEIPLPEPELLVEAHGSLSIGVRGHHQMPMNAMGGGFLEEARD